MSATKKQGVTCNQTDPFQEHPCQGTMRRKEVYQLGLKHLVTHMAVWETHLLRLANIYSRDCPMLVAEVVSDIKKLNEWRERLDAINPRRDRKNNVSLLQGDKGSAVPESNRQSIEDPPVS